MVIVVVVVPTGMASTTFVGQLSLPTPVQPCHDMFIALPFDGDAASWTVIVQFIGGKVQDVACAAFSFLFFLWRWSVVAGNGPSGRTRAHEEFNPALAFRLSV
ncbi:hypothetical protein LZ32DRAFT_365378 [Colletotrichum eremochloae]|nr:hypothetical protein LZ32DRAFT_365378 [Colletotrichum eremochloae]